MKYSDGSERHHDNDSQLHRTGGPAYISSNGTQEWYKHGDRHRADGPAIEKKNGGKVWYLNGKLHRIDGPAVIDADGSQEWYVNGEEVIGNKEFQKAADLSDEEMTIIVLKYRI